MTPERQPAATPVSGSTPSSNRGRLWLIIGLALAAVLIVAVVLFFVLPRDVTPGPGASSSPSPTTSVSESPGSPSPSPSPDGEGSPTPEPTELDAATQRIDDQLNEASADLDAISSSPAEVSLGIVAELQDGAQRLADSLPGAGVDDGFEELQSYSAALEELSGVLAEGGDVSVALNSARDALAALRAVVRS